MIHISPAQGNPFKVTPRRVPFSASQHKLKGRREQKSRLPLHAGKVNFSLRRLRRIQGWSRWHCLLFNLLPWVKPPPVVWSRTILGIPADGNTDLKLLSSLVWIYNRAWVTPPPSGVWKIIWSLLDPEYETVAKWRQLCQHSSLPGQTKNRESGSPWQKSGSADGRCRITLPHRSPTAGRLHLWAETCAISCLTWATNRNTSILFGLSLL